MRLEIIKVMYDPPYEAEIVLHTPKAKYHEKYTLNYSNMRLFRNYRDKGWDIKAYQVLKRKGRQLFSNKYEDYIRQYILNS